MHSFEEHLLSLSRPTLTPLRGSLNRFTAALGTDGRAGKRVSKLPADFGLFKLLCRPHRYCPTEAFPAKEYISRGSAAHTLP
jgi:hypothetical protein